jgi:PAS domain S-box-containing protein
LWFLPLDGVSVIDPHHLVLNKLPPPVHIEQIVADGKTYDLSSQGSGGVHLPPRVRDLTIDYTALSLVVPEKVRFRFKLEGQDADWREVVNQRRVEYSNLPPRHYRFRLMACNNSGVWNEEGAALDFAVDPAYWQTNWFRALCAAAFLAVLLGLYRARIQQLRRQERKLRDVIETIPTFAWTALPDGSVDFVNRHWQEYTGLSAERTAGSGWHAAVHTADLKRHAEKWRVSLATGEPFENEVRYRRAADEQYRWFLARAVPLRDQRGKILKWYGISTDIEDRKRAEQEREGLRADLAHVNRVSTLGEMAATLAHEIKQPIAASITSANTCIEWLAHEPPNLDRARAAAGRIDKYGNRAAEIIDRIRSLYKKSPPQRLQVEVNEIIREMVELLRAEANLYAVSIRTDLVADLPKINADRVQLQQVFMNLILNAIEAMKETGGVLTVKTQLGENGQLLISVSDTGVGLPKEKTEQIFDTFFTTKPQGSGMGLSISRSIVESHGGRLWATANDGRGATFHFTLPTPAEVHDSVASGNRAGPGDGSPSNDPVV